MNPWSCFHLRRPWSAQSPASRRARLGRLVLYSAVLGLIIAGSAQARVIVGFGLGLPLFVPPYFAPPPAYYPPPVYYAPPPVYYPPPAYYSAPPTPMLTPPPPGPVGGRSGYSPQAAGQSCNAGAYLCPMEQPVIPGTACYCRGNQGQKVWGRAG